MRNEGDAASFKACRLVVDRPIHLNRLTVEAGRVHGFNGTDGELQKRLKDHIKAVTGVGAQISIRESDTLPRASHKAKWVEEKRGQVWMA
ncbi:hypothetical protein [Breoghania sp.]|uniref:hypothetical protein n=1 Tax=Breoghania sp. TaxID=2065378 RepID=UPI002AA844F8|nr:hypothetical protein [Breoghania sp.]